jgi:hypothetical protein
MEIDIVVPTFFDKPHGDINLSGLDPVLFQKTFSIIPYDEF